MPDIDPFMKSDAERIIRIDVLRQPVNHLLSFRLKATEETVPNDEHAGMIAVEILVVRSVMDTMMRWRVHHPFQRPHATHQFGMDPELVEQTDGLHGEHHDGRKANQRQPQPEDERHEVAGPGLAQRCAQIVMLR